MSDVDAFGVSAGIDPVAAFRLAGSPNYRAILDSLPAAIYTTDTDGTLTYFNRAAVEIAGREPRLGIDKWCVSTLYRPDGTVLPPGECPMAIAIREQRAVRGVDIVIERPDGRRIPALPFPTPIYDSAGRFTGAINLLVDISRLKSTERQVERHAIEQAALYHFTDRLYRAETDQDIYEAALDAILGALGCDRASVLLFDDAGVMRFVASRGLSPAYQAAVDGHSPWKPGDRDPSPIFVPDIMASDESEGLKRTVKGEGLTALGFIPLTADGVVIGKFMTYHEAAHQFSNAERDLAVTIARQLGFAIDRRRTERTLHESTERLRLATEAGKVGLWDWDIPGDAILWTDSLYAVHGVGKRTQSFAQWLDLVHPDSRGEVLTTIDRALRDDAPYEIEVRTVRPDGSETWVYTNAVVLRDAVGVPLRMVGAAVDITKRRAAEDQRDLLVAELSHRVKNTLATVVSIARQSFGKGATLESARKSFEARLRALAQTHTRLAEANWESVPLAALIEDEIAPYRDDGGNTLLIDGPPVSFTPKQAVVLGMALHELATNAAKYGALSSKAGTVRVLWRYDADGRLLLDWQESGGPTVVPPKRSGFGRLLLERALAADLQGEVELDFRPSGLACRITLPLDSTGTPRPAS